MRKPLKVVHVTTGLFTGGAERMLYKLLSGLDREAVTAEVISLADVGPVGGEIRALGIPVRGLGMRRGLPDAMKMSRLIRWLRESAPDVVQTWMYHADLIGGVAAKMSGSRPVIWNIRHADLRADQRGTTRLVARLCARLSRRLPARIVCCSEASRRAHADFGYAAERMLVIPNGFDLEAFKPDAAARCSVRRELGIPPAAPLVGLVARFRPEKDHRTFLQAAGRLAAAVPDAHFLLCGEGVVSASAELRAWIGAAGIRSRCRLLGPRNDMARINAALDVACSSSYSEGFSNAVGEAMACAVPCVVTDVGDSRLIVGDAGMIVPPKDPQALAAAWEKLVRLDAAGRARLGTAARRRIRNRFALSGVVERYRRLYEDAASDRAGSARPAPIPGGGFPREAGR